MNDAWKFFKKWSPSARYERKLAKRYAETVANPFLSAAERAAIDKWRLTKAKREAWDECVRELFISAARGKILVGDDEAAWEIPANPYGVNGGKGAREKHADAVREIRESMWDEGRRAVISYALSRVIAEDGPADGLIDQHVVGIGGYRIKNPYARD